MELAVKVFTKAKQNVVKPDNPIKVYTTAAPENGKANEEVRKLLAKHFDVPKSSITIVRGETSQHKIIQIHAE